MSERLLVQHCSPTLAGMKTGNMFSCTFESLQEMKDDLRSLNGTLVKKGVRVLPLRYKDNHALIYVFRPALLMRDLSDAAACKILQARGYYCESPQRCVVQLIHRLNEATDFPHEVGLFLGYPPEDVNGFIENKADGCKCIGHWKVYGDENKAQKLFAKYKKCTSVYCEQWAKGKSIERLTVSF